MRRGRQINTERAGRVCGILSQSADDELHISAGRILDRRDEIHQAIGSLSHRLSVWGVNRDAIDKHDTQIRVLCGALSRDVRRPSRRKKRRECGVGNMNIELKTGLGAVFHRRLRTRRHSKYHDEKQNSNGHIVLLDRPSYQLR